MILGVPLAFIVLFVLAVIFGFRKWALVSLGSLALILIGLILVIPNLVRARTTTTGTPKGICLNASLRNIQGSKEQWALEHTQGEEAEPTIDEVAEYMAKRKMPVCGEGGICRIGKVGEQPVCSKHGTYQ